jgi:endonuclease/exonuclease/phosphatase family metal-dependent hydrolase
MSSGRLYRLLESSLIALFVIQAIRLSMAVLVGSLQRVFEAEPVALLLVYGHGFLLVAVFLPLLSPRRSSRLSTVLSLSAILVAILRVIAAFSAPSVRLISALLILGIGGIYFTGLARVNRHTWVTAWIAGMALDQLFRARDAYDISMRLWLEARVLGETIRFPWVVIQIVIAMLAVGIIWQARRHADDEPRQPASLTIWSSLSMGCFLAIEMLVLAMPNVAARWAGVTYGALVPWLLLATVLPLIPGVRNVTKHLFGALDEWLQGWVWLFALLTMLIVGNRVGGMLGAGALVAAQFAAVMLLWAVPVVRDGEDKDIKGFSLSLAWGVLTLVIYAFSLTIAPPDFLKWLAGQSLGVVLVAGLLHACARVVWRGDNRWVLPARGATGLAPAVAVSVVVTGFLLASLGAEPGIVPADGSLRVATYNINGGFDAQGVFQVEQVARTIEASRADIVLLQEVDAGRPAGFGIDQVQFLARRLGMYQAFAPTADPLRGLAVLSRWPLELPMAARFPTGESGPGVLKVGLALPQAGAPLAVLSVQMAAGDIEERIQQYALLAEYFDETGLIILAGDLGSTIEDIIYQQLVSVDRFTDPDAVLGIEQDFTTPADLPQFRHDYILLRGLAPIDARQVESTASDHRLVVVEVEW